VHALLDIQKSRLPDDIPAEHQPRIDLRQNQILLSLFEALVQQPEIQPRRHELTDLIRLRQHDRRLHIRDLQVVPTIRVDVLMVVVARQPAFLERNVSLSRALRTHRTIV